MARVELKASSNISALIDLRRYPPETLGKPMCWQQAFVMDTGAGIIVWVITPDKQEVSIVYGGDGFIGIGIKGGEYCYYIKDPDFWDVKEWEMLPKMYEFAKAGKSNIYDP